MVSCMRHKWFWRRNYISDRNKLKPPVIRKTGTSAKAGRRLGDWKRLNCPLGKVDVAGGVVVN